MQHVRIAVAFFLLLAATAGASARILFVDATLAADCVAGYDPATRRCGPGIYWAYRKLSAAADAAVAGDTVVLRGGTYSEQLAPKQSGTAESPIVFGAFGSEQAILTGAGLSPAIWINGLSHITIRGLTVQEVGRWMAVLGSHHISIIGNLFRNANDPGGSSKTGLFFQASDYNVIRNNVIDSSAQDNIALVASDHNLIQENVVTRAAHALWAIKCGSYNVVRRNHFRNEFQKIGEIYDCAGVGYGDFGFPKLTSLDDTRHNVVEENIFSYTATPVDASPYAGIQHAGQQCIIRGNTFFHCLGPPIDLTLYADEAQYNYGNRIYNNVFYENQFGGISISGAYGNGLVFSNNVIANNAFYRNRFTRFDTRWDWYRKMDGKPVQIITGRIAGLRFVRNELFSAQPDELWVVAYGDRTATDNESPQPLSWWEANLPSVFTGNMQAEPKFADTLLKDFHPAPGSPLIDAGAFVAQAVGAGSGTTIAVNDAWYFRDGYGIPGLGGDTIQLQQSNARAVVVAVDYESNTLTLDAPLEWRDGEGVSLKYNGAAPDIGALESVRYIGGVADEARADDVLLYPNPTGGRCTVTFPPGTTAAPRVRAFDMYGRLVRSETAQLSNGRYGCAIDLGGLPAGAYLVVIETKGGVTTRTCVRK